MSGITRYDPNYHEEMMEPDVDGRYVRWDCYLDAVKERDTLKAKYDDLAERNRNGVYVNELLELNATYLKERDALRAELAKSRGLLVTAISIIRNNVNYTKSPAWDSVRLVVKDIDEHLMKEEIK